MPLVCGPLQLRVLRGLNTALSLERPLAILVRSKMFELKILKLLFKKNIWLSL